jgi:phospholipase C
MVLEGGTACHSPPGFLLYSDPNFPITRFADPNVQINPDGHSTFYQYAGGSINLRIYSVLTTVPLRASRKVNSKLSNATDYLLPFHLSYLEGDWPNATMCMEAGSNSWESNHLAVSIVNTRHWSDPV